MPISNKAKPERLTLSIFQNLHSQMQRLHIRGFECKYSCVSHIARALYSTQNHIWCVMWHVAWAPSHASLYICVTCCQVERGVFSNSQIHTVHVELMWICLLNARAKIYAMLRLPYDGLTNNRFSVVLLNRINRMFVCKQLYEVDCAVWVFLLLTTTVIWTLLHANLRVNVGLNENDFFLNTFFFSFWVLMFDLSFNFWIK